MACQRCEPPRLKRGGTWGCVAIFCRQGLPSDRVVNPSHLTVFPLNKLFPACSLKDARTAKANMNRQDIPAKVLEDSAIHSTSQVSCAEVELREVVKPISRRPVTNKQPGRCSGVTLKQSIWLLFLTLHVCRMAFTNNPFSRCKSKPCGRKAASSAAHSQPREPGSSAHPHVPADPLCFINDKCYPQAQ